MMSQKNGADTDGLTKANRNNIEYKISFIKELFFLTRPIIEISRHGIINIVSWPIPIEVPTEYEDRGIKRINTFSITESDFEFVIII